MAARPGVLLALATALGLVPGRGAALTATEAAGKRIYSTGESASGAEITALMAGDPTPVPATSLPCASCHGDDGLGRPEGAVVPSVVTWSELTRPGGHAHPGRSHGPFDARTLARSIEEGVDPAGQPLDAAMPRYSMSRADREALLAYLRVLERQTDPGLGTASIRIGTVLPERGPLAEVGRAMQATLEGAFREVNATGGINGRRLELAVAGFDPARQSPRQALERLAASRPLFALVSGFAPGGETELAAWAEQEKVPAVGPFTPFTRPAGADGQWTFYLQPGLAEQGRVLVEHAAGQLGLTDPRAVVLRPEGDPAFAEAAAAALRQAEARGWTHVEERPLGPEGPLPGEVARLAGQATEVVVFLGDDRALAGFLEAAQGAGWTPWVLAAGTLAARAAAGAPARFEGRLRLAYPSLPEDETEAGRARLARLAPSAGKHHAARVAALASATVLAEALGRTGRQLSRARLVATLEGLYQLGTGLMPPVSYGPRRRVGALGGYVVAVDLGKRRFQPVGGWIRLD